MPLLRVLWIFVRVQWDGVRDGRPRRADHPEPPAIGVNQDGRLEVQYRTAGSTSTAATTDLEIVAQNTPSNPAPAGRPVATH